MYNTTTMHRIQDRQTRQIYNETTKERYKVYIPPGFTARHNTLPRLINNWVIGDMADPDPNPNPNLNLQELGEDVKRVLGFIPAVPFEAIQNDDVVGVVNRPRPDNDNDRGDLQRRRFDGPAGVLDDGLAGGVDNMDGGRRRKSSKRSIRRIRRRSSKRKVRKSRNARRK